jgi:hypothetical protein
MQPTLRRASAALLGATVLAGSFATTVAAVDPAPSTTTLSIVPGPQQDNHPVTLVASVDDGGVGGSADNATIDFVDQDGHGPSCLDVAVDAGNQTTCPINDPAVGTYHYVATYSGNATVAGSASDPVELVIVADSVDASNVKVNYSTFYPVKDGYRDALTISGNRQESIGVTISIYNSSNKRVRLASKSSATGAYSYAWNGRNSKGDVLPAGKYRIVQKLVDTAGTNKSFTSYANLSTKKLVTLNKAITKNGSAITAGAGNIATSSGVARLKGGSNAAIAGYQFKIPSAVVYKSLSFRVNAAARLSAPSSLIAMQNFNVCDTWNTTCFDRAKAIGSSSGARKWYSTSGSPSSHRKGLVVRGLVGVPAGTVYVYKAEFKVTYQVLK